MAKDTTLVAALTVSAEEMDRLKGDPGPKGEDGKGGRDTLPDAITTGALAP